MFFNETELRKFLAFNKKEQESIFGVGATVGKPKFETENGYNKVTWKVFKGGQENSRICIWDNGKLLILTILDFKAGTHRSIYAENCYKLFADMLHKRPEEDYYVICDYTAWVKTDREGQKGKAEGSLRGIGYMHWRENYIESSHVWGKFFNDLCQK